MIVRFRHTIEVDVVVEADVEAGTAPGGWDPGDPGGAEILSVNTVGDGKRLDVLPALSEGTIEELREQASERAMEEAEDAAVAAAESRRDD